MKSLMKLGTKIALGFGCLLIIVVLLLIVSLVYISNIRSVMELSHLSSNKLKIIHTARETILTIKGDLRGLSLNQDQTTVEALRNEIIEARGANQKALAAYKNLPIISPEEKNILLKNVSAQLPPELINQALELVLAKNRHAEALVFIQNQIEPRLNAWRDALEELSGYIEKSDETSSVKLTQTTITAFGLLIVLGGLCLVLGFIIAFVITRSITKPLENIITNLTEGAQQVAAASNQLSSSAEQLSQGSAEQASSIEETSSTLQETASMLQQNSANTQQAAQLSEQAKESANKGSTEMQGMLSSIQEIKK